MTRLILCVAFLSAVMMAPAAESCCDRAKAAGKECTHKCCIKAAKSKKVCEKCNSKDRKFEDLGKPQPQ